MCLASLIRAGAMWQLQAHLKMDLGERVAQGEKCSLSKYPHLLNCWETSQPMAGCCAFMPKYHFVSAHHGIEVGVTTGKVKGPVGHHYVLFTAAGVVESASFAYWCARFIHLLQAISSVSAGFQGLPVALVSFLWHLSFTGSMRNSIQIFFFFLDHLHTCTHRKYCFLIVLLELCLSWLCPCRSGSQKYRGWDNLVIPN